MFTSTNPLSTTALHTRPTVPADQAPASNPGPSNRQEGPERTDDAPALPQPGAQRRIAPLQLAGYAFTRAATGAPLRSDQAELLLQTQTIVDHTRATLHHGRGNVTTDVARTGGEAATRSIAARTALQKMPPLVQEVSRRAELLRLGQASAAAAFAGAGRCGEHARVALTLSAPHLREGDTATLVENFQEDHSWVAINRETDQGNGDLEAIADAWGEGPAFLAEDGEHTRDERGDVATNSLQPQEVRAVHQIHQFVLSRLPTGDQREAAVQELAAAGRRAGEPEPRLWPPTPVLHPTRVWQAQDQHAQWQAAAGWQQPTPSERVAIQADMGLGTPQEVAQERASAVVEAGLNLPVARSRPGH